MSEIFIENVGIAEFSEEILLPNDFTAKSALFNNPENQRENSETVCYDNVINVYPNPADKILTVEYALFDDNGKNMVSLVSIDGKTSVTMPIVNPVGVTEIDVSNYPAGTYFVIVGNGLSGYTKQISIVK